MSKFCCFFCPSKDYSEKSLDDLCPTCGRTYGFVLNHPPTKIRNLTVIEKLNRGFYGAAYIATSGFVGRKSVVKITPVEFYEYFNKPPFQEEVELHAKLASNSTHVVGISDAFDEVVSFSNDKNTSIECYVTVMDYVEGQQFKDFATGEAIPKVASICQVAIDLLQLQAELAANKLRHNDLHSENLIVQSLRPESRRPDAIDNSLRVMAIDLGSISDESKSSNSRLGDLAFIAEHVDALLSRLLARPDVLEDRDFRIALALQGVINSLGTKAQNNRLPNPADLIEQIRESFFRATHHWRPWRTPLNLKGFSDHFNAQTLESWDVPKLLVDPENRWLEEITSPGPQIVTGMRGCGKTILLRSLDIHARLANLNDETPEAIVNRIRQDEFIGLFVSAQRLLDLREQPLLKTEHRLARLFVAYALQAVRALMHLNDVDHTKIFPGAHLRLASAISDILGGAEDIKHCVSLDDLEHKLQRISVLTARDREKYQISQSASEIFIYLANTFRACSEVFNNSTVFFLLDDISTRYLELDKIDALLSALLFQNPSCAFKFTSEWQTIELGLKSPGRIHPIRIGRDLTVFDLGADVFSEVNAKGNAGKNFVSMILLKRASIHAHHPDKLNPKDILGDVPLEQVAREIGLASKRTAQRKSIYRGLSCLTSVCVGDIGDVIKLYEEILKRGGDAKVYPIPSHIQSDCFQEICSMRLYDLNRRSDYFKNHALAFAQAAHDLLVRSSKMPSQNGKPIHIRQFSSIYVRVTVEDENIQKQQIDNLRELIDAGVFVFAGGAAPRAKTNDSNPIQQFKLSYRKVYGLAAFIGLADRDRFELSGSKLSEWLAHPEKAKEILMRSQHNDELDESTYIQDTDAADEVEEYGGATPPQMSQAVLFGTTEKQVSPPTDYPLANKAPISITQVLEKNWGSLPVNSVLTGLGFEDRTLASNEFLSGVTRASIVHAIRYELEGNAEKILATWKQSGASVSEVQYREALIKLPHLEGLAMVDISGLSKPLIFKAIRGELSSKGRVFVCHASADKHYPLNEDIEKLFAAEKSNDPAALLNSLAHILMGEKGPYDNIPLLDELSDSSRSRAMLAFASAKHERLFSLLDKREFDQIEVIAPNKDSPRAKVATYAAEFACQNFTNAKVSSIDSNDLAGLVDYLDTQYLDIYGVGGSNLELGLTGSKIQAVAAAILSSVRKVSQAWYLSPKEFDVKRFSTGGGEIRIFDIKIGANS